MASGRLGGGILTANQNILLYTVPSGTVTTANIGITNRSETATAVVEVYITQATTPASSTAIEANVPLPPGGILERTGLVCGAGERIYAKSTISDCTARVHGFEEAL